MGSPAVGQQDEAEKQKWVRHGSGSLREKVLVLTFLN
jgi:hypothetical protein